MSAAEEWTNSVFERALDGCDEDLGSVDGFGWFGLLLLGRDEHGNEPWAILHEDSQGFKSATPYDTEQDARVVWDDLMTKYIIWCGAGCND
jgi:hypothetical protein